MLAFDVAVRRPGFALEVAAELGGGITGLFGSSGSGKTTLLHALAGLTRPSRGRISVGDEVLFDAATGRDAPPRARHMGVVFQDARLFPHYSVAGNLRYGERLRPPSERRVPFDSVVALLELGPLLERPVPRLSGGEQQRVALGRALLASPRWLLLDEPLAALDRRLKRQILPFFRRVHAELGIPMLYVSHELPEVLQLTDQLLVLEEGRAVARGRYADVALRAELLSRHNDLVNVVRAAVERHDEGSGVTEVRLGGVALVRAPLTDTAVGSDVVLLIRPEDVALALHPITDVSIQNQLEGTVRRVREAAGQILLEIDVGATLLVQVTPRTRDGLHLGEGQTIWCLIKSNAVKVL